MYIEAIGKELAKNVKTQKDMTQITGRLVQAMLGSDLNAKLDEHLSYGKSEKDIFRKSNARNGFSKKKNTTDNGDIDIKIPSVSNLNCITGEASNE